MQCKRPTSSTGFVRELRFARETVQATAAFMAQTGRVPHCQLSTSSNYLSSSEPLSRPMSHMLPALWRSSPVSWTEQGLLALGPVPNLRAGAHRLRSAVKKQRAPVLPACASAQHHLPAEGQGGSVSTQPARTGHRRDPRPPRLLHRDTRAAVTTGLSRQSRQAAPRAARSPPHHPAATPDPPGVPRGSSPPPSPRQGRATTGGAGGRPGHGAGTAAEERSGAYPAAAMLPRRSPPVTWRRGRAAGRAGCSAQGRGTGSWGGTGSEVACRGATETGK